jgi:hypothetical protein
VTLSALAVAGVLLAAPAPAPTDEPAPKAEATAGQTTEQVGPGAEIAQSPAPWGMRSRTQPRFMADSVYRYLTRPLNPSARHLDHGVIEVSAAGGSPHLYRVAVAVGLFDHVNLGVTAHWLGSQSRPQVSPRVAVAFYRWRIFEVGALHFWTMYPPPSRDPDPATDSFQRSAKWILGTATFAQRFLSAGVDAGAVRARIQDPSVEPQLDNESIIRWRFGGGLHLRAGTRRWGVTAQAHLPYLTAELVLDVRFGAFELRPRGGWRPAEEVRAIDRRMPTRH